MPFSKFHKSIIASVILVSVLAVAFAYFKAAPVLIDKTDTPFKTNQKTLNQPYISIPREVRLAAAKELQENLLGAKLTKANRDALNSQINDVGLYINESSDIELLAENDIAAEENTSNGKIFSSYAFYASHNEEEEEEEISRQDFKAESRELYREKLLMQYIYSQLQNSLKTDSRYKGKRAGGSEYIQEQLRKYG